MPIILGSPVWDLLLYSIEIVEFGARISTSLDVNSVSFDVTLKGVEGRELVSGEWRRELHGTYFAPSNAMMATLEASTAEVVADPRGVGVDMAQQLLQQFGLEVSDQVLLDWQNQVFKGR